MDEMKEATESPDLNPLDFFLWGNRNAIVYKIKIHDIEGGIQHYARWSFPTC